MRNHRFSNHRWGVFMTGIGIGAAAGLLLARYSTDEMQAKLLRRAGRAKNYLKDQAGVMADRAGKFAGEMDEKLAKGKGLVRDLNSQAKEALGDASEVAAVAANNLIDKSRAAISKAAALADQQRQRIENA